MGMCFKQQVAIDSCVKLGKDIGEMCALLQGVYSEEYPVKRMIQHWHKSFHNGCQKTDGSPRTGSSRSSITMVNINTMEECISNRRRIQHS